MTDQPQQTDAPVDAGEGRGKRAPFVPADPDDVAGHGRWPTVRDADGDGVEGQGARVNG